MVDADVVGGCAGGRSPTKGDGIATDFPLETTNPSRFCSRLLPVRNELGRKSAAPDTAIARSVAVPRAVGVAGEP